LRSSAAANGTSGRRRFGSGLPGPTLYAAAASALGDDVVPDVEQAADWLRIFIEAIEASTKVNHGATSSRICPLWKVRISRLVAVELKIGEFDARYEGADLATVKERTRFRTPTPKP
jgi:hypothetical protein